MMRTGLFHTSLLVGLSLFVVSCGDSTTTDPGTMAVTDLRANSGPAEVRLSWDIPSTGTMAEGYMVFRSTTPGTIDVALDVPVATTGVMAVNYTDTGLTNYTSYYYVVAPATGGVAGPASEELQATPKDYSVEQMLRASDAQPGDTLGKRVAMKNGIAVVATYTEDGGAGDPAVDSGALYIFEKDNAGVWAETAILRASDAQTLDGLGLKIAIDGSTVLGGAPNEDGGAGDLTLDAGAAYVFDRQADGTWLETQVLHASVMEPGGQFGNGVAISGNTLVVGAPNYPIIPGDPATYAGAAFVFEKDPTTGQWIENQILRSADLQAGDLFGVSISLEGNTMVLGASGEDGGVGDPLLGAGASYVFEKGADGIWVETHKNMAPDAQAGDNYGYHVVLQGNTFVLSAYLEDGGVGDPSLNTGAAYLYTKGADGKWQLTQQLHSPDKQVGEQFSAWVSLYGDSLVVGSWQRDIGATLGTGGAILYTRDETGFFNFSHVFSPAGLEAGDSFGNWIAVHGSDILISAPYGDVVPAVLTTNEGEVYFY